MRAVIISFTILAAIVGVAETKTIHRSFVNGYPASVVDKRVKKNVEKAVEGEMSRATPESQGVDSAAILEWIESCEKFYNGEKDIGRLHGFVIVRHGKVIAEGSWKPFDTLEKPHVLYSHSKSFTAAAIGFLIDDGKLDLDERVGDIFPEDLPAKPAEGIREIRIRDLLTMNVGSDLNHDITRGENWKQRFFERKLDRKPGTGFKYDSDATYILAAIAEKRTGKKLMDFLKERMFDKLGIEKAWTTVSPQGIACGGWGMNMTTREIARFGLLYLQKGRWGEEQLLSEEWTQLASSRHTWCDEIRVANQSIGKGSDWKQGYGFQFWRSRPRGVYRADGASGQATIIMPEQDAVVSIHAGVSVMQEEFDFVWNILIPAMKDKALPENSRALAKLREKIASLAIPPVEGVKRGLDKRLMGKYELAENSRGIERVELKAGDDGWRLGIKTRAGENELPIGLGEWKRGMIRVDPEKFEALGALIGDMETAASAAVQEDGSLKCRVYLTNTTHYFDFDFKMENEKPRVEGRLLYMGGTEFKSK